MPELGKFIALQILRGYKWAISPMFPPACRYVPSCSEYAIEAVERYGVLRGGVMAIGRLLRCHPFVRGGYDPVVKCGGHDSEQSRWQSLVGMLRLRSKDRCAILTAALSMTSLRRHERLLRKV
jgi:uncharacterized protein